MSEVIQLSIDKEKVIIIQKILVSLTISKPSFLVHAGDEFCWLQYYMLKFLEREALVVIDIKNKEKIKVEPTDLITVGYYNNENGTKEVQKLCVDYLKKMEKKYLKVDEK